MYVTAKNNFMVGAISGFFVVLRTRKACGCNTRDCYLLKKNFIAELFMKHLSNKVWSSNFVALQPVDVESSTPVKCQFFESFIVGVLLFK